MLETLYSALIAPIEEGFLHALPALQAVTGSWGLAIVLLSVAINLALLPFYRVAEEWQKTDREIQARLKPRVDALRSKYTGYERFMMTKTLYRQAGYHPLLAIRSVAGVLMQIPVLLAAYYFLLDFEPIVGVGFGPVPDLTRPDGLLRVGGVRVNVLPLAMTAINLASVSFASSNLAKREKVQLWVVAFAFLLLLYTMPAGLVLFWTANNVFSFFNALAARHVKSYPPAVWWFFELAPIGCLFAVLVVLDPHTLWLTQTTLGVNLALAAFLYSLVLRLLRTARFRRQDLYGIKRLLPMTVGVIALLVYAQAGSSYLHDLILLALDLALALAYFSIAVAREEVRSRVGPTVAVSALALSSILFVFNPLLIYFSSPGEVGTMNGLMMTNLVVIATIATFLLIKAQCLAGRFADVYAILLAWAASAAFVYSYVAIRNYGVLRGGRFTQELVLLEPSVLTIGLDVVGLVLLGAVVGFVVHSVPKAVPVYLAIVLGILSVDLAREARRYFLDGASPSDPGELTVREGLPKLFSFGTDRNVLLIVPDAAQGTLLPELLREAPELGEGLRGFVYYGNTAAVGTFTMSNTPALIGGPSYVPAEVNARAEGTLAEVIVRAYRGLFSKLQQNGFAIDVMGPSIVRCDDLAPIDDCDYPEAFRDLLYERYDFEMVNAFDKRLLFLMSGFKASPLSVKSMLYRSEYWDAVFSQPPRTAQSQRYYEFLFVESLPELSEVRVAEGGRAFVHLWLDGLVAPFFLNGACEPAYRAWDMWDPEARNDSTRCLLGGLTRWFDWMRDQGVYDNTKIIIAADHGATEYGDNWYRGAVTPLLMVKDFHGRDDLRQSDVLMSNSDVLSLICGALERGCDGVPADPTKAPYADRAVSFSITTHGNPDFARSSREFDIVRQYRIRGSVHDVDAWELEERRR